MLLLWSLTHMFLVLSFHLRSICPLQCPISTHHRTMLLPGRYQLVRMFPGVWCFSKVISFIWFQDGVKSNRQLGETILRLLICVFSEILILYMALSVILARGSELRLLSGSVIMRRPADALLPHDTVLFLGDGDITLSQTEEHQSLRKQWVCFSTDEVQTSSWVLLSEVFQEGLRSPGASWSGIQPLVVLWVGPIQSLSNGFSWRRSLESSRGS